MFLPLLVACVFLVGNVELLGLPSYITPCSLSDPEFQKCAISTARRFFEQLVEGDKDLKIPPIGHLVVPPLYFNNSEDVYITVTDGFFVDLQKITFLSIKKIPMQNKIGCFFITSPELGANFVIDSKIGDVIIAGKGPGTWKLNNLVNNFTFEWQIIERDGVKYTDIINIDATVTIHDQKLIIEDPDNNNINELLRQYIQEIVAKIYYRIPYYGKRIFTLLTHELFTSVPYNEVFLE